MLNENSIPTGIYEQIIDKELKNLLKSQPNLISTIASIDQESSSYSYSQFLAQLLRQALSISKPEKRWEIINKIINLLATEDGLDYLTEKTISNNSHNILHEIRANSLESPFQRPVTSLSISSLLTGAGKGEYSLDYELRAEMMSADQIDILVSFIKWSGLRLLRPAFEYLEQRGIIIRIITTSYMGASDPEAIQWLSSQKNVAIKISYDTGRTRLHAKAYHFIRKSGFSTAYIGSANMSHAAMTSGLEWTVKVTAQDMPHIIAGFDATFQTYWENDEFVLFEPSQVTKLREAISLARGISQSNPTVFFADIRPYPFQERILDALKAARQVNSYRNLVIAATGTGKTVIAAFDYFAFQQKKPDNCRLLFIAHRKEILNQARACFRTILRDQNFGELLVDGETPNSWNHVFASIQSFANHKIWQEIDRNYYHFIILDEAHHGTAASYRTIFDNFQPNILLGLTATPERMDGSSILPDFDNRFAAEIRLPEALEEKLLCPFHYFGVSDSVDISAERFWKNGKYDTNALTDIFVGDHFQAKERLDLIIQSIKRYQPNLSKTKAIGFCASVRHARFMAEKFCEAGFKAEELLGETPSEI